MNSTVALQRQEFASFFQRWLQQHEANLQKLLAAPRDPSHEKEHQALLALAMDHYCTYYAAKRKMARASVGELFNPPWLSSTARALMWMAGWRPSSAFRLVRSLSEAGALGDPSEAQRVREVEELRGWTKVEEERLEREMRRLQLALPGLARLGGDRQAEDAVMRALLVETEKVVAAADELRVRVLEGVVGVLTPLQGVDFLVAAAMLQLQLNKSERARDGRLHTT